MNHTSCRHFQTWPGGIFFFRAYLRGIQSTLWRTVKPSVYSNKAELLCPRCLLSDYTTSPHQLEHHDSIFTGSPLMFALQLRLSFHDIKLCRSRMASKKKSRLCYLAQLVSYICQLWMSCTRLQLGRSRCVDEVKRCHCIIC